MKRILLTFVSACVISTSSFAFKIPGQKEPKPAVNYTEWLQDKEKPETSGTAKLFYPETLEDGKAVIKGSLKVNGLTRQQIFLASWLYFMENADSEKGEELLVADPDNYSISVITLNTVGSSSKEASFCQKIDVNATEDGIDFKAFDVKVKYKEKGLIPRTLDLEALHPESNSRHAELVMSLSETLSKYVDAMARFDATRPDIEVPKLQQVLLGKVLEGMNPDEVKLILGTPWETRKSGEKDRWIYAEEITVIFEEGKVIRVIGQR